MTTNPDFERAILADPRDTTARTVYADWLDENDNQALAEFIRVQTSLGNTEPCRRATGMVRSHGKAARCAYCDLTKREQELLAAHDVEWAAAVGAAFERPTGDYPFGRRWAYAGGFPGLINLDLINWWVGGWCPSCDGVGDDGGRLEVPVTCTRCKGSGQITGYGRAVVRACPVTKVTVNGLRPWYDTATKTWQWFCDMDFPDELYSLPYDVCGLLTGQNYSHIVVNAVGYPTEQAALADLSDALIRWARRCRHCVGVKRDPCRHCNDTGDVFGKPW